MNFVVANLLRCLYEQNSIVNSVHVDDWIVEWEIIASNETPESFSEWGQEYLIFIILHFPGLTRIFVTRFGIFVTVQHCCHKVARSVLLMS